MRPRDEDLKEPEPTSKTCPYKRRELRDHEAILNQITANLIRDKMSAGDLNGRNTTDKNWEFIKSVCSKQQPRSRRHQPRWGAAAGGMCSPDGTKKQPCYAYNDECWARDAPRPTGPLTTLSPRCEDNIPSRETRRETFRGPRTPQGVYRKQITTLS